ncbi:MAG TPA: hypothetical protein VFM38_11285 [Candidatus Limnocylindrales bacterium]|nr:hypothetical protein [Candidatus Limnocylindrales bacterium]
MPRVPRLPSPLTVVLAIGMIVQAAAVPFGVVAKVPSTATTLTPLPNNVAAGHEYPFVTAGDYIAFDFTFQNTDRSNIAQMTLADTFQPGDVVPTYAGTFITGGSLAGQTSCAPASSGAFSCNVGMAPNGATLSLRIVYLTSSSPGTFTVTIEGLTTGTPSTDPGTSHGDTFSVPATIETVDTFADVGDLGTSGFVPPSGDELQTNPNGFGASNPMWTKLTVPSNALTSFTTGTTAFLEEVPCGTTPDCIVQKSHITLAGGSSLAKLFRVEIMVDNAKKFVNLNRWTIDQVSDDDSVTSITTPCTMVAGRPTNTAPCIETKGASTNDKNDFVAVVWLLHNGYIKSH